MRVAMLAMLGFVLGAGYASRIPAATDYASVVAGGEVLIDVLANDGALGPGLTLLRVSGGGQFGTAVREGNQVRYTAAAGVAGHEQLSYSVRRANGQVAGGRIFVTVEPPTLALTLQGEFPGVEDTCDLAVVVGSERFEGCTAGGGFQIDVSTPDAESVVVIEATARPSDIGDSYRFASVLGSMPRLLDMAEHAGTPGVLDASVFGHLRLQEYTTMHHAQLVAEGGAGVFASESALAQVQKDLDAQRLHALAVSFRAARRGWVSLPAGIDDPYAFASDLGAFDVFYATAMAPAQEQALDELVNHGAIQMPWPDGPRIGPVLGGLGAAPGNINVGSVEGTQVILEDMGRARVYSAYLGPRFDATWAREANGHISVQQDDPAFGFPVITLQCDTGPQAFMKSEFRRLHRVTRVIHTAQSDVSLFQTEVQFANIDDLPEGCTTSEPELRVETLAIQTYGRGQVLPIGEGHTDGRWAVRLPAPSTGTLGGIGFGSNAGIIDFDASIVQAPGLSETITVNPNLDNGLDIALQAGPEEAFAAIDMQVFRTRTDGRGGEQWLGNMQGEEYSGVGIGGLSVRETDPGLFSDVGEAWGAWRSGFGVGAEGRQTAFTTEVIFDVQPGSPGVGVRYFVQDGGGQSELPFGWEVDGTGRLVMTTWYSMVTFEFVDACIDECYVYQRRTWQPVSLDVGPEGKRLYLIEEILQGNWYDDQLSLISRRVNFYDETVAPERAEPAPALIPRARMR